LRLRSAQVLAGAGEIAARAESIGGAQVVAVQAPGGLSGGDLRTLAMEIRGRLEPARPAVVVLISDNDGVAHFVAALNPVATQDRLSAGDLVKAFAPVLGARGGGKADLAQGAGGDPTKISAALDVVRAELASARQ
jgi:alanyl-tRNA synthetase